MSAAQAASVSSRVENALRLNRRASLRPRVIQNRHVPNTKHKTPNTKHQTPNTQHQISKPQHQFVGTRIALTLPLVGV